MSSVFHFIRLAAAVIFGITAAVCIFVALPLALPCAATSIAFSLMPEA